MRSGKELSQFLRIFLPTPAMLKRAGVENKYPLLFIMHVDLIVLQYMNVERSFLKIVVSNSFPNSDISFSNYY